MAFLSKKLTIAKGTGNEITLIMGFSNSPNLLKRNEICLIKITKSESEAVRKVFPRAEIVRTCIQKSKRHRYYLPEAEKYLRLIVESNAEAAAICATIDKERERRRKWHG